MTPPSPVHTGNKHHTETGVNHYTDVSIGPGLNTKFIAKRLIMKLFIMTPHKSQNRTASPHHREMRANNVPDHISPEIRDNRLH